MAAVRLIPRMGVGTLVVATALGVCIAQPQGGAAQQQPARTGGAMPGAQPQLGTLKLPAGFTATVYAERVPGARSMALAPDGTLFVGTRRGTVYAIQNRDGDHTADSVIELTTGLRTPNGVAFKDGSLYVAELNRIVRFDDVLGAIKSGNTRGLTPKIVLDGLPSETAHGWKYLSFGPDGYLYYQIGAPCNICDRGDPFAAIWRVKPDGSGNEIVARGVRNSVGQAWHPETHELWFTDNGRDLLGDDKPNDELNRAPRSGLHFGYPYCHEGEIPDPEFGEGHPCSSYQGPAQKLGPHVAALGLEFYTGGMFPPEYKNRLFIAQHGSWNRTAQAGPIGYRIMTATIEGGRVVKYELFADGFLQGRLAWGRPVDLLQTPDGALLVSDDTAGAIYRIAYAR
ncbi:MAG: sorbosone dehydrogenase family protein [Vicinamibacterales bacterium]